MPDTSTHPSATTLDSPRPEPPRVRVPSAAAPGATPTDPSVALAPQTREFYRDVLRRLLDARVPFVVGGAYALTHYTGVVRPTKDLDLFLRQDDAREACRVLAHAGYDIEQFSPHWLSKAGRGDDFVDLLFNSGNGLTPVDDDWLRHAEHGSVLGIDVPICPMEETIWSKAFIMERERFDGGDVAHLFHALAERLDWCRLVERFDGHWRVLLAHLVLFGFIYPGHRRAVPTEVMDDLLVRLRQEQQIKSPDTNLCRGTLLSRGQYLLDVELRGYRDGRLPPEGTMVPYQIDQWTARMDEEGVAVSHD